MTCTVQNDTRIALVTGGLTPAEEEDLRSHLANCPECRREVEELTVLLEGLDVPPDEVPSERLRGRIESMIRAYDESGSPAESGLLADRDSVIVSRFGPRARWTAGLLAAGVAGLLIGQSRGARQAIVLQERIGALEARAAQDQIAPPDASSRLQTARNLGDAAASAPERLRALEGMLTFNDSPNVRIAALQALALASPDTFAQVVLRALPAETSIPVRMSMVGALDPWQNQRDLAALRTLLLGLDRDDVLREPISRLIAEAGP